MLQTALILINTRNYPSHHPLSQKLTACFTQLGINAYSEDISDGRPYHVIYSRILTLSAPCVLSLDLAGTEMLTESGRLALNQLSCRTVFLLTRPCSNYPQDIFKQAFNFSMFFYFSRTGDASYAKNAFPNLPNIFVNEQLPYWPEEAGGFPNTASLSNLLADMEFQLDSPAAHNNSSSFFS